MQLRKFLQSILATAKSATFQTALVLGPVAVGSIAIFNKKAPVVAVGTVPSHESKREQVGSFSALGAGLGGHDAHTILGKQNPASTVGGPETGPPPTPDTKPDALPQRGGPQPQESPGALALASYPLVPADPNAGLQNVQTRAPSSASAWTDSNPFSIPFQALLGSGSSDEPASSRRSSSATSATTSSGSGSLDLVADSSTSTIIGTGPVTADGASTSTITITLLDLQSRPVSGQVPTFSATDTGGTNVYTACSASNASGVSTCTVASTKAETKTLSILTPVVKVGGTVVFSPGAVSAANSTVALGAGSTRSGASTSLLVTLKDAFHNIRTSGGDTVKLFFSQRVPNGPESTGAFSSVTDNLDGTYSATVTGLSVGVGSGTSSAGSISALGNGTTITSSTPSFYNTVLSTLGVHSSATTNATTANPMTPVVGDFNRDGKLDIVMPNYNVSPSNGLQIFYRNSANTGWDAAESIATDGLVTAAVAGDFNNDGYLDLAYAAYSTGDLYVLYRNSTNTGWDAVVQYATAVGSTGISIDAGDLNGDGRPDIALGTWGNTSTYVFYRNSANTTFSLGDTLSNGGYIVYGVKIDDYNNDGQLDVATAGYGSPSQFAVFYRNGANTGFLAAETMSEPTCNSATSLIAADFDNNGTVDLASGCWGSMKAVVFSHNAALTAWSSSTYAVPAGNSGCVAAGDLNGDSLMDLVIGSLGPHVYLRKSDNSGFESRITYGGSTAYGVALGDIDGNGTLDIVNSGAAQFRVYWGTTATAAQSTVALSTNSVSLGSGLTVTATITTRNASGTLVYLAGLPVSISNTGGTSAGAWGAVIDNGDGTYTSVFTPSASGTATTVTATVGVTAITSSTPSLTVTP